MKCLYQTIKEIIDTGRVGEPVFVRYMVQISPKEEFIHDCLINTLAKMVLMTGSWMNASPRRVYAQNGNLQLTVSAQFSGGQIAILSVNAASMCTKVDLTILGNKGALYHDGICIPPDLDSTLELFTTPDWLINVLKRSLDSGQPEIVQEEECP